MKADDYDLRKLLHGGDQFVVPVFQRYYVWERGDWQRLWDDILNLLEPDAPDEHFMGSLVCVQGQHQPGRVPHYIVIDGQQRLTTFGILLSALRDEATDSGLDDIAGEIADGYLTQPRRKGLERYRVVLRTRDRQTLFDLLDGEKNPDKLTRIGEAYHFFRREVAKYKSSDGADFTHLYATVTSRLPLVMIILTSENPFNIFETLNGTGQDLKESDLVRNFVFMNIPIEEQDEFDATQWEPMERSLDAVDGHAALSLTDFYRDYLMREGRYVPLSQVYVAFRREYGEKKTTPSDLCVSLSRHAQHYKNIWRSVEVKEPELRRELSYLARLGVTTAYPLVLHLLEEHHQQRLDTHELARCLRALQSFAIRRSITGESTRRYGRLFPAAIRELWPGEILATLVKYLDAQGWPADDRFVPDLVRFRLYTREGFITRLMLRALEEDIGHKEQVDVDGLLQQNKLQIEHVMPQGIGEDADGDAWRAMLGAEWDTVHQTYLHTLGNLTLTGYNPELSNHAYERKREEFAHSHLELTRQFVEWEVWDEAAIVKRADSLAKRVVALWPTSSGFEVNA